MIFVVLFPLVYLIYFVWPELLAISNIAGPEMKPGSYWELNNGFLVPPQYINIVSATSVCLQLRLDPCGADGRWDMDLTRAPVDRRRS